MWLHEHLFSALIDNVHSSCCNLTEILITRCLLPCLRPFVGLITPPDQPRRQVDGKPRLRLHRHHFVRLTVLYYVSARGMGVTVLALLCRPHDELPDHPGRQGDGVRGRPRHRHSTLATLPTGRGDEHEPDCLYFRVDSYVGGACAYACRMFDNRSRCKSLCIISYDSIAPFQLCGV